MAKKTVAIGVQDFEKLRIMDCFYVDKTSFIFFSNRYEGRGDLFEGLSVWEDEAYHSLQGTYPVISLTFAGIKYNNYETTRKAMNGIIAKQYARYRDIMDASCFNDSDRVEFRSICEDMPDQKAAGSLNQLCEFLERRYGKKCIVLLDEYDTPMQEAYIGGFWDEMVTYIRSLFNNTFKTNEHLERGLMTGITRISKESIFSDLNNLTVVTTTSGKYATSFGFTEDEVFDALEEQGFSQEHKEEVKRWYDGFAFRGNECLIGMG